MIVHFMATYYSQWAHDNLAPRSQQQWDAFKFCRAVKSKRISGSLTFPWTAGPEVINETNVSRARWIFGLFIKETLASRQIAAPILLPVPSKDGLIGTSSFRSSIMLNEAIASHGAWNIVPALRFKQALTPAHAGGPRGRYAIGQFLHAIQPIPDGHIVLIDDIVTTGGSLLASFDALSAVGRAPVAAIVCGHTVSDSLLSPFGHHQKSIDTSQQTFSFS